MCSKIVTKSRQYIIKIKSHIMCIIKTQSVAPVHFRIVRCHQFKKKHHVWLLSKVFTDLEKVFSLKWRCPPWEAFHWRRRECSTDPAVRLIVKCWVGVNPGQEGIVLRIKQQTGFLESAEVGSHRLSGPSLGSSRQSHYGSGSGRKWARGFSKYGVSCPSI